MAKGISDEDIVKRVLGGETALYEVLIHRYNQRLFRICRAILGINAEARDVVQHTYAKAFEHLRQFEGRARFSTWLTRIAIHEASLRRRRSNRIRSLGEMRACERTKADSTISPEEQFSLTETRQILESMIDALPEKYRVVQIMRDIEGMSVAEAAECLGTSEANVNVRLHRARGLLRKRLYELFGSKVSDVFRFHLSRCDRVVCKVSGRTRFLWSVTTRPPESGVHEHWPSGFVARITFIVKWLRSRALSQSSHTDCTMPSQPSFQRLG